MGGANFPDSGYVLERFDKRQGWYGEPTHWGGFQNFFLSYLQKKCKKYGFPPRNSKFCEHQWALYFGVTAHSMGDVAWDGNFVPRVALSKFGNRFGSYFSRADSASSNSGDSVGVVKYRQRSLGGSLNYSWALDVMNAYADSIRKPRLSKSKLAFAHLSLEGWYWALKIVGFWIYLGHKRSWKWATDNYYSTTGGINWGGVRIAKTWDMMSEDLKRYNFNRYDTTYESGRWPYITSWLHRVNGSRLQLIWPDYNYPGAGPPGKTYPCRWGLYWGRWRIKSWGPARTCSHKGAADNAKRSCFRVRRWWFKCKHY